LYTAVAAPGGEHGMVMGLEKFAGLSKIHGNILSFTDSNPGPVT
jgi:hypothetical protein